MAAASSAQDFIAFHPETDVSGGNNIRRDKWLPKTRPACPGFELRVAGEERQIASGATEDASVPFSRSTANCAGVSEAFHSALVFSSLTGGARSCVVGATGAEGASASFCWASARNTELRHTIVRSAIQRFRFMTGFDKPGRQPFTARATLEGARSPVPTGNSSKTAIGDSRRNAIIPWWRRKPSDFAISPRPKRRTVTSIASFPARNG